MFEIILVLMVSVNLHDWHTISRQKVDNPIAQINYLVREGDYCFPYQKIDGTDSYQRICYEKEFVQSKKINSI